MLRSVPVKLVVDVIACQHASIRSGHGRNEQAFEWSEADFLATRQRHDCATLVDCDLETAERLICAAKCVATLGAAQRVRTYVVPVIASLMSFQEALPLYLKIGKPTCNEGVIQGFCNINSVAAQTIASARSGEPSSA